MASLEIHYVIHQWEIGKKHRLALENVVQLCDKIANLYKALNLTDRMS